MSAPSVFLLVSAALTASHAHGADFNWNNPGGGSWAEPSNWVPMQVPAHWSHRAIFDFNASFTVALPQILPCDIVVIQGDLTFDTPSNIDWQANLTLSSGSSLTLIGGGFASWCTNSNSIRGLLRSEGPTIDTGECMFRIAAGGRAEFAGTGALSVPFYGLSVATGASLSVSDSATIDVRGASIGGLLEIHGPEAEAIAGVPYCGGCAGGFSLTIGPTGTCIVDGGASLSTTFVTYLEGSLVAQGAGTVISVGGGSSACPDAETWEGLYCAEGSSFVVLDGARFLGAIAIDSSSPLSVESIAIGGPISQNVAVWSPQIWLLDGSVISAPQFPIAAGATVFGHGTLAGNVTSSGLVAPARPGRSNATICAHENGVLHVAGNYQQQLISAVEGSGTLLIHIGGESSSIAAADKVEVEGTASLGGTLDVRFGGPCVPESPQTYTILTATEIVGEFELVLTPLLPGWVFEIEYQESAVLLHVMPQELPGDLDDNNAVGFSDLNILLGEYGSSGAGLVGDLTHDGFVGFDDLNLLLSYFGFCWE